MNDTTLTLESTIGDRFSDILHPDERNGYEGFLISKSDLIQCVTDLKIEMGYDYLASLTGVDYLPEGKMEVVYHLRKTTGGSPLVLKVQVSREDPEIPSLVPIYPGAEFQEREVWDLYGIKFTDHPDLRRILMWEGFHGHPMRKDYREGYYEEDGKPFKSRWPDGNVWRSEEHLLAWHS